MARDTSICWLLLERSWEAGLLRLEYNMFLPTPSRAIALQLDEALYRDGPAAIKPLNACSAFAREIILPVHKLSPSRKTAFPRRQGVFQRLVNHKRGILGGRISFSVGSPCWVYRELFLR